MSLPLITYDTVISEPVEMKLSRTPCSRQPMTPRRAETVASLSRFNYNVNGCSGVPLSARSFIKRRSLTLDAGDEFSHHLDEPEQKSREVDAPDNPLAARFDGPRRFARICGAVAQLGARVTGSHEATGSNPVSSTITFPYNFRELAHQSRCAEIGVSVLGVSSGGCSPETA